MGWIKEINNMPDQVKEGLYRTLIPPSIFMRFQINPLDFCNAEGQRLARFYCSPGDVTTLIEVKLTPEDRDCIFSFQLADTTDRIKINWDFIIINDPFAERVETDIDKRGCDTLFGTAGRNIEAELRAMELGLWPGQVRQGLSLMPEMMDGVARFSKMLGIKNISLEALFYHNAILYEHYGFTYFEGYKRLKRIDELFRHGILRELMNGVSPFRRPEMADTVWGRSWAIHDGILDEIDDEIIEPPWISPEMYVMIESPRGSVTFENPKIK